VQYAGILTPFYPTHVTPFDQQLAVEGRLHRTRGQARRGVAARIFEAMFEATCAAAVVLKQPSRLRGQPDLDFLHERILTAEVITTLSQRPRAEVIRTGGARGISTGTKIITDTTIGIIIRKVITIIFSGPRKRRRRGEI